ncbi:hypothetical protein ACWGJ2_36545 [Streptomyces sp. NPDC054796]
MTTIDELWTDRRLPVRDALHFPGDGGSYDVVRDPYVLGCLGVRDAFDAPKVIAEDPEWLTTLMPLEEVPLEDGGFLWGGEGSWGSEGFFARVRADDSLRWVVFFTDSNPFEEGIDLSDGYATFHSSADLSFTVDIEDPRRPVRAGRGQR